MILTNLKFLSILKDGNSTDATYILPAYDKDKDNKPDLIIDHHSIRNSYDYDLLWTSKKNKLTRIRKSNHDFNYADIFDSPVVNSNLTLNNLYYYWERDDKKYEEPYLYQIPARKNWPNKLNINSYPHLKQQGLLYKGKACYITLSIETIKLMLVLTPSIL